MPKPPGQSGRDLNRHDAFVTWTAGLETGRPLRKLFVLAVGWFLLISGLLIMPLPVPIPFIGAVPLLFGCAILSSNSRFFRRALQGLRHRFAFLSRFLERLAANGPHSVKRMIKRTNPHAFARYLRMQMRELRGRSRPMG